MDILKAVLLGALQGLTEFLPVSSSGHLAIFSKMLGFQADESLYFDILLHVGTLAAIFVVFHKEVWKMICEFIKLIGACFFNLTIFVRRKSGKEDREYVKVISNGYRKLVLMILISTVPTGILGLVGKDLVVWATQTLWMVGICLFLTAGLLVLADFHDKGTAKIKNAGYGTAFLIGVGQGVATMPGLSRSGTTIAIGMWLGLEKKTAVRYSFLMSIPAVLGAVVLDLKDLGAETVTGSQIGCYAVGMIVAFVTGYAALRWMLKLVKSKSYCGFAFYCGIIGFIAVVLGIVMH